MLRKVCSTLLFEKFGCSFFSFSWPPEVLLRYRNDSSPIVYRLHKASPKVQCSLITSSDTWISDPSSPFLTQMEIIELWLWRGVQIVQSWNHVIRVFPEVQLPKLEHYFSNDVSSCQHNNKKMLKQKMFQWPVHHFLQIFQGVRDPVRLRLVHFQKNYLSASLLWYISTSLAIPATIWKQELLQPLSSLAAYLMKNNGSALKGGHSIEAGNVRLYHVISVVFEARREKQGHKW